MLNFQPNEIQATTSTVSTKKQTFTISAVNFPPRLVISVYPYLVFFKTLNKHLYRVMNWTQSNHYKKMGFVLNRGLEQNAGSYQLFDYSNYLDDLWWCWKRVWFKLDPFTDASYDQRSNYSKKHDANQQKFDLKLLQQSLESQINLSVQP